jgi:hypothetical protein
MTRQRQSSQSWPTIALCVLSACTQPRPTTVQIVGCAQGPAGGSTSVAGNPGGVIIQQRPPTIPGENPSRNPGGSITVVQGLPDAGAPSGARIVDGDFLPRIDSEAAWNSLAARRERDNAAHTDTVKVVIDLSAEQIYFLQTRRWEIHYFFIRRFLGRPGLSIADAEAFWQREYLSNERRFVQGSIVRYATRTSGPSSSSPKTCTTPSGRSRRSNECAIDCISAGRCGFTRSRRSTSRRWNAFARECPW